ncbi:MAG: hypothetical protein AVDCRST_MAG65-934, partial [uncultured Solirubrobacteraceae bacterium]
MSGPAHNGRDGPDAAEVAHATDAGVGLAGTLAGLRP